MVRSTSSCLKIIACGRDSVDKDDFERMESKGSTVKRGWSFGKRSARHRVLSNTVVSETASAGSKESPEAMTVDFHPQTNPTTPEKISVPQWIDGIPPQLSTAVNSKIPDPSIAMENAIAIDSSLEESVTIVIQAAIRGYLAQRELLKLKNVVKLQAAVRGHLVRRQAVGTLRCVQAIVKMQALVRARRARLLVEGSVGEEKPLGSENSGTKGNKTYYSTEKLCSNGFARQLLESTPKSKPIHIKCDPSRPNSAWKWLERWMSVSSSGQGHKPECPENQEQGENTEPTASEVPAEVISVSENLQSNTNDTVMAHEGEESLTTYEEHNFDSQAGHLNCSLIRDDLDQPRVGDVDLGKSHEASSKIDLLPNQTEMQSSSISQTVPDFVSEEPDICSEQAKPTMETVASEQLETEGKKFVFGSRKTCNPAFVAAQSKFEELSSTDTSGRSINFTYQDVGEQPKLDALSSPVNSLTRTNEFSITENLIPHDPKVPVGGSECGTEISISSTLDSPDISEVGGGEFEHEAKFAGRGTPHSNSTVDNASNLGTLDPEAENVSSSSLTNSSHPDSVHSGKPEDVNRKSIGPFLAVDSLKVEQQPERSVSDVQIQLENVMDQQADKSSPEGSPRSHITAPESHGTPSSQVSIKAKRNKLDRSGPNQNRRSQAAAKRSPSNQNHDSGARSSMELLLKDPKNEKRRNSFGLSRPDLVDQELRDSSNNNSLPNYMQATESARAKVHVHNSPRSSPDIQDKDIYIKKRHSLPSANGKQGSPRIQIQRSVSQVQHVAKGNGTHSPHERKWQR